LFEAKAEPEFNEYVGNRIDVKPWNRQHCHHQIHSTCPYSMGRSIYQKAAYGPDTLSPQHTTRFHSGAAINMYMMQWSRPEIFNATRDLTRLMHSPNSTHEKALKHLIQLWPWYQAQPCVGWVSWFW
jgi:hypothetical protein